MLSPPGMRVLVSLSVALSVAFCWQPPAAAQRMSQEPPREPAPVTPVPPAPRKLPYEAGQPSPPGYHLVERPRTGAIITGSVVFGVTYGFTAVLGFLAAVIDSHLGEREDADDKYLSLMIPVGGPIALMAIEGEVNQGLILVTALQAAGVGLIVFGATTRSRTLVLDRPALGALGPMPVAGGGGLALSGTF